MSGRRPRRSPALGLGLGLILVLVASAPDAPVSTPPVEPLPTRLQAEPEPFTPAPMTPALTAMAEARYQAAQRQFDEIWLYYRESRSESGPVYYWSRLLLDSRRDLCRTRADWVAALEEHRARMLTLEALVKRVNRLGMGRSADRKAVDYYRLEVDYWLARARRG